MININEKSSGDKATMARKTKYRIIIFLILEVVLSGIIFAWIDLGGFAEYKIFAMMWTPAISAIITSLFTSRPITELGFGLKNSRWLAFGYLGPFLYAIPAYILVWVFKFGGFYNHNTLYHLASLVGLSSSSPAIILIVSFGYMLTIAFAKHCFITLGEEIGWRGFLVPEFMKKTNSFTKTALITGIIWSLWHFPAIIFTDYNSGASLAFVLPVFTIFLVAGSFAYTWIRMKTNSVWPAMVMHAIHNILVQQYLSPLTIRYAHTAYFIDEFGIAMVPFMILIAYYFFRRRNEVELSNFTS